MALIQRKDVMKYSSEIVINKPVAEVAEKFANPDNLKHWQPGFEGLEHLEGTAGQAGAKSRLTYNSDGRKMEMIETITVANLPQEFTVEFITPDGGWSSTATHLEPAGDGATKVTTVNEFKPKGIAKVMMMLVPFMFKKMTNQYMTNFKAFCETGASVAKPAA
jgi:carbon monoxide dehydrogenase subunit G